MKRNLLITGGAGFIGTNLVYHWVKNNPSDSIFVLDNLTYAGNIHSIKSLIDSKRIVFRKGDLRNINNIRPIFDEFNITDVIHLAAESHVDRSISGPENFIYTNIIGTFNIIESFRLHWEKSGRNPNWRFLHVSTDEVFGSLSDNQKPFNEQTAYNPRSPYSASKASSDHIALSWFHTYGLPVLLSNCSNNYGPYHFPEKLIPLALINIILGKKIPIYGNGINVRDWLYVEDHCNALDLILKNGDPGDRFCIGGNNELTNIKIIQIICELMDDLKDDLPNSPSIDLIEYVKDRPGHDYRYAINSQYIRSKLGWKPKIDIYEGLKLTANWFMQNRKWWEELLSDDYLMYLEKHYGGLN